MCPCTESNPVETGFYYLNSRYYDPNIGRFISPDRYTDSGQGILGTNMFAYCLNNPVNRVDPSGSLSIKLSSIPDDSVGGKPDGEPSTDPIVANETGCIGVGGGGVGKFCVPGLSTIYFENVEDAVNNWFDIVIPLTAADDYERGAFILKKKINGKTYYYMSETYVGERGTVWYGFVAGYVNNLDKRLSFNMVGFAHTHTAYSDGTYDLGPSGADRFLFLVGGINRQFIGNVWNGFDDRKDLITIPYNRYEFDIFGRVYP